MPDPARLQQDLDAIADAGVPAAFAYVVDDAAELFLCSGPASADLTPEHCWRVGSVTKPFIGVVVLQLVEEGRVRLRDPLDRYLTLSGPPITIEQMLCHRSGLRDYVGQLAPHWMWNPGVESRPLDPASQWELVRHLPRQFAPGTRYEYSNTNYLLLGQLIEHLTGQPLARVIEDRVCSPLGLARTRLAVGPELLPAPYAPGWEANIDALARVPRPGDEIDTRALAMRDVTAQDISWAWAAGAMISTAADLARFLRTLVLGEGLIAEETRARMLLHRRTDRPDLRYRISYGLGACRFDFPNGASGYGHTGGLPGYYTYALSSTAVRRTAVLYMGTMKTAEISGAEEALERAVATALQP